MRQRYLVPELSVQEHSTLALQFEAGYDHLLECHNHTQPQVGFRVHQRNVPPCLLNPIVKYVGRANERKSSGFEEKSFIVFKVIVI